MSELYFGYCDAVVTPPQTVALAGYAYRSEHGFGNSGVMDDIYARVLSLKSGNKQLILLTIDICGVSEKIGDDIRERVAQKLQIPVENVMLSLSHTHSGPVMGSDHSNNTTIKNEIDSYVESLIDKIVTISSQASKINHKGKLYTSTFTACMGYNRRYTMKDDNGDNKVKMLFTLWRNPGHDTNGTVDPHIPILVIESVDEKEYDPYLSQKGTDRIVLFNVATHPVVMGQENRYVSADYPGAARRCIENTLGDGTKAMFLLGACGNVNSLLACQNNPKAVEIVGNTIGFGVCAALSYRKEVEFDGLNVISEIIKLKEGARADRVVTQVFKIGKAAIAAVSCECFTELGIRIRNQSKFDQTLVATNSNGGDGYIPTREVLETSSGYEVDNARKSGFDENLLDRMVETVVKKLSQLIG